MNFKHGHSRRTGWSRTYKSWKAMKNRCLHETFKGFKNYGGRGIKVCDRWMTFENFLIDMGERPKDKTLGRINNDGDYCKENCSWQTKIEQDNNRVTSHFLTFNGEKRTLIQWSRFLGIDISSFRYRMAKWPRERWFQPKRQMEGT